MKKRIVVWVCLLCCFTWTAALGNQGPAVIGYEDGARWSAAAAQAEEAGQTVKRAGARDEAADCYQHISMLLESSIGSGGIAPIPDIGGAPDVPFLLYMRDGAVYGVAQKLYQAYMEVSDAALWQDMGLSLPADGWTFSDFVALGDAARAYEEKTGRHVRVLSAQGMTEPFWLMGLTVDAPVDENRLAAVLDGWKQMVDGGWIAMAASPDDLALITLSHEYISGLGRRTFIPYPVCLDTPTPTLVSGRYYVLNAQARNAAMAGAFLNGYAAQAALAPIDAGLLAPGTTLDTYLGADSYQQTALSAENFARWMDGLETGLLFMSTEKSTAVVQAYQAFMNGEMDAQTCAKRIAAH